MRTCIAKSEITRMPGTGTSVPTEPPPDGSSEDEWRQIATVLLHRHKG